MRETRVWSRIRKVPWRIEGQLAPVFLPGKPHEQRGLAGHSPRVPTKSSQSCPTLRNPMDHKLPGSSVHGLLQARILGWTAVHSFRGSSQRRDRTHVSYDSCTGRWVPYRKRRLGSPGLQTACGVAMSQRWLHDLTAKQHLKVRTAIHTSLNLLLLKLFYF